MKTTILLSAILLTGCATGYVNPYLDGEHSSKNIEQRNQYQKDYALCELEAMKVGGSNLGEQLANELIYKQKCMKIKGY